MIHGTNWLLLITFVMKRIATNGSLQVAIYNTNHDFGTALMRSIELEAGLTVV